MKNKKKENNKIVKLTIVFFLAIQSNTKKNTEQDIKCMNYQFAAWMTSLVLHFKGFLFL